MKKFFSLLGLLTLFIFSFYYTEKTVSVVKEFDEIMIEIKEVANTKKVDSENATIKEDTIIPGKNGLEVDINKSYSKMRKYGKFNESLLYTEEVTPKKTITNNYDKYVISGNPEKRQISFIFLVKNNDEVKQIVDIANNNNVKFNFFIDNDWLEKNNETVLNLINEKHSIGNISNNFNYDDPDFAWIDTVIKRIGKQKTSYCYLGKKDKDTLELCSINKNYTIIPNLILKNNIYTEIKEKVEPGNIISLEINDSVIKELPVVINYLKSKDFTITNLETHLSEELNTF